MSGFLRELLPQQVSVHKDLVAGRIWIHHRGLAGSRKNYAWTKRGMPAACALALAQAWAWEIELEGTPCPLPAEFFNNLAVA